MRSLFMPKNRLLLICLISLSSIMVLNGQINDDPFEQMKSLISTNLDSAIIIGEQFLSENNNADSIKAKALFYLGVSHYYRGQYHISSNYYELAINTRYATNNIRFLGRCYNNLGIVLDLKGEYAEAIEFYIKSMEIDDLLDDSVGVALSKINIGLLYINMLQLDQSDVYLQEAKQFFLKANDYNHLGLVYHNIALLQEMQNKYDSSFISYNKAADFYLKANNKYEYVNVLIHLGSNYKNNGDIEKALESILEAQKLAEELGYDFFLPQSNLVYCGILIEMGDTDEARKIINNIKSVNPRFENEKRALNLMLVNQTGSYAEFKNALNNYINYRDSVFIQENNRTVNEINLKYETEQKEAENQRLKNENRLQELVIFRQKILVFVAILVAFFALLILVSVFIFRKKRKERIALLEIKNKEINEKSEQLKISNETKDKLFSIIAHDLRSPFTSLLGFSSLLKEETEKGKFENAAAYSIHLNATAVNTYELIDNLLNWTRSQQNHLVPNPGLILLSDVVNEIILSLNAVAIGKHIEVVSQIEEDIEVMVDKNMLLVILRNLIGNALKFSYKGGKVIVDCEENNENYIVSIKDNGKGMEASLRDKIFSDNTGVSSIGTENEHGSGLGLILVKEFVKKIDGKVWVESVPEEGSTFSFTIPKGKSSKVSNEIPNNL